jgi:hypothetical protein
VMVLNDDGERHHPRLNDQHVEPLVEQEAPHG